MNYTKFFDCELASEIPVEEEDLSNKDIGLAIDEAHNAKVQELLDEGKDPSLLPDRIYRNEDDYPSKAFCFTGNGLYFSGTMCWSGYLDEWGVCHLSYPGWASGEFVGEGVKAALEGIKETIKKNPALAKEKHLCFYGSITAEGKFVF
jgi:hypothetical protein